MKYGELRGEDLLRGGYAIDLTMGPDAFVQYFPRDRDGAVGTLSLDIGPNEPLINDAALSGRYLNFVAGLTPATGFCWADHETVLEQVQQLVAYDDVKALCWLNIFGPKMWDRLDAELQRKLTTSDSLSLLHELVSLDPLAGLADQTGSKLLQQQLDPSLVRHVIAMQANPYTSPEKEGPEINLAARFGDTNVRGYTLPAIPDTEIAE